MLHTRAIIFSTKPYREYDELISLFTERFGKRTILARGTRKPTSKLAAPLHGTNIVRCSFVEGRGFPILTALDQIQNDGRAEGFYSKYFLYAFLALCEDILYEGDVDEKLWTLLSRVLQTALTTGRREKEEWICVYDEWLRALLCVLGIDDTQKNTVIFSIPPGANERPLLRKAFAAAYYKNPYPLEPFLYKKA